MKWLFLVVVFLQTSSLYCDSTKDDYVIGIHGFLGHPSTMHFLKKRLQKEGWEMINWKYPSRDRTIQEHAQKLVTNMQDWASKKPMRPLHFVAHSMGCLVLRAALNHPACPYEAKIGKAVLFAPPNQGTAWGRCLRYVPFVKKIAKDAAGKELMTEKDFQHLGDFPSSVRVLVIAGNAGFNPFIPGENDGTIGVDETYLNTPHEHRIVDASHKSIVFNKKAYKLTKYFLEIE